jgi:hypothetical protein
MEGKRDMRKEGNHFDCDYVPRATDIIWLNRETKSKKQKDVSICELKTRLEDDR